MHRRRGGGVTSVQSSCSFICCPGMWTGTTRRGEQWQKSNPWWNQEVKDVIRAKKVSRKAWLHNKTASSLHSRYVEARKSANLVVENSEMHSWNNFGRKMDSNYWKATKMFKQTIRLLRWKRFHSDRSIKEENGVLLRNEKDILDSWREYFKDLLNPVTITPAEHTRGTFGEENTIWIVEVHQRL